MICAPKNRRFFGGSKSLVECLSVCTSSNLSINYMRCCAFVFFNQNCQNKSKINPIPITNDITIANQDCIKTA